MSGNSGDQPPKFGYYVYVNDNKTPFISETTFAAKDWPNVYKVLENMTEKDLKVTKQGSNVKVEATIPKNGRFGYYWMEGMKEPIEGDGRWG